LVLQRAGDQKLPYRPYWVYENPDVLFVRRTKLLRESWDEAMHMVRGENKIIALMEGRVEMPGAIIPPEYVYEMHHAFPHLKHLDPIHHISRRELAEDFETIKKERLWNHQHLVVVGDEGHPALAIAHWGLVACDLEADKEGHLRFKDAFAQYAFSGKVFDYQPDPEAEAQFKREFGDLKLPDPPAMSVQDAAIVAAMVARLERSAPGRENYAAAVRGARIEL
jgi:hypothetical protein